MTLVLGVIAWRTRSTKTAADGSGIGKRDLLHHDSVAPGPLLPAHDHAAVILIGDDHFVSGLQIDAEDQGFHRLGRIAGDGDFLGVAAKFAGEVAAHRLDPRLEDFPQVFRGQFIGEPQVADHLVENVGWRGADAAVVEVDDRAVGIKSSLDLRPVIFIGGELARLALAGILVGARRASRARLRERWRRSTP